MDAWQDFKSVQDKIQSALVATTKSANGLAREDLSFLRAIDPAAASKLDDNTARLLRLSEELLKSAGKFVGQAAPELEDADDVDINWRAVVDVIDTLLEKADTCLDEYTGLVKRKDAPTPESGRASKKPKPMNDRLEWSLKRANIIKPQNAFERKVDNFDTSPWKPLLTKKPHATVPLDKSLTTFIDGEDNTQYKHPYETEILQLRYPQRIFEKDDPIPFLPIESTTAVWVDTYEGVLEMLEELKKAEEIAVDLEHHDYRTYPGLLSLMQISTREKDWIVDTLRPWRHRLEILNEVFADPSIIKVLHGAFMDIIWLQRDLGLYMVNLFDTHYASDALDYPGKSLAYLLKKFADFDADKKYQLADWRIRPLPEEMFYYARSDTHYLLYIYDKVRNELVARSDRSTPERNWIEWVLQKSKEVSLQRYETPLCDAETGQGSRGWFNVLVKSPAALNAEQFAVYRAVFKWRDDVARAEDESPHFTMPQHVVGDIARVLPADPKALWSLLGSSSQGVKGALDELMGVVSEARERGAVGPSMFDFFRGTISVAAVAKKVFGDAEGKGKGVDARVPDIGELKAEKSQLWGDMPISSRWEERMGREPSEEGEIALPWTTYVQGLVEADAMAVDEKPKVQSKELDILPLEDEPEPEVVRDDGFTLKQGRKRKIQETEFPEEGEEEEGEVTSSANEARKGNGTPADTEDMIQLVDDDDSEEARKAAKKARKLARKQVKRMAAKAANGQVPAPSAEGTDAAEDEPFDYSKAPSVLHAQGSNGTMGRGRGKREKVFDPYAAKTQDAPKGARKMNYEKAGRTATFEN